MLIRLAHEYDNASFLRQSPANSGIWEDITFTEKKVDRCDILLCLTYPQSDIEVECRESWLLSLEPPARMRRWERSSYRYFDRVLTTWPDLPDRCQPCVNWFPDMNYDQFHAQQPPQKHHNLSWVTSNNADLHGHKLRHRFISELKTSGVEFDLYGRGFTAIADKADGLLPYKYSLAIENFQIADYWTEKIADPLLCWSIPFYWGAPNIDSYFPAGSYIAIDPRKPEWSLQKINEILDSDYYEKHLPLLAEARKLVLERYQLLPYMCRKIRERPPVPDFKRVSIPYCPHPREEGGITKLKYKFDYFLSKYFNV